MSPISPSSPYVVLDARVGIDSVLWLRRQLSLQKNVGSKFVPWVAMRPSSCGPHCSVVEKTAFRVGNNPVIRERDEVPERVRGRLSLSREALDKDFEGTHKGRIPTGLKNATFAREDEGRSY